MSKYVLDRMNPGSFYNKVIEKRPSRTAGIPKRI